MNTRFFSALAALAVSTTIAGAAMARDTGDGNTGNDRATLSQSLAPSVGAAQSAQLTTSPSARGSTGTTTMSQPASDGQDVNGVPGVKVGRGPGYAWWKDR